MTLIVKEILAKTILSKSKIYPRVINPYTGCSGPGKKNISSTLRPGRYTRTGDPDRIPSDSYRVTRN